jgi:hypothetical protein
MEWPRGEEKGGRRKEGVRNWREGEEGGRGEEAKDLQNLCTEHR